MLSQEIPVSAVARIVQLHEYFLWGNLKHYVEEARKEQDLSELNVLEIDKSSMEKHCVYVTLFYDIKNRRTIHI